MGVKRKSPPPRVYPRAELIFTDGFAYIKSLVATKDFEGYALHHTAIRVLGEKVASMEEVVREAMAATVN